MSGPVKRWDPVINGAAMRQTSTGAYALFSDYEAVVRELAEAREKLESVTVVKDGMIRVSKELSDEVEKLRALLDALRIAVMEMHHDNVKGDFELPPLARIDLDACVAKCSDERIPRAGGENGL